MNNLLSFQVGKHFSNHTLIFLTNRRQFRPLPCRLIKLTQRRQTAQHFSAIPTTLTSQRRTNSQHMRFTNNVKALMKRHIIQEIKFNSSKTIQDRSHATQDTVLIMRNTNITQIIIRLIHTGHHSSNNKRTRSSRRHRRSNRRLTR